MLSIAIALAAAASQTAPAELQTAPADLPAWVAEVNRRIDKHMVRPTNDDTGMATIAFRRGDDGRPVDITAKSGSPALSRAALRTIKAVGVLPIMPASMASNQRVVFKLLVGHVGEEDGYLAARKTMLAAADSSNTALAAQLASKVQVAATPVDGTRVASLTPR